MSVAEIGAYLATVVALGVLLVPFVQFLTGLIKNGMGDHLRSAYYPTVALVCGLLLAVGIAGPLFSLNWRQAILVGIVAGGTAAGMFDYGKSKETPDVPIGYH